ncbi:MAG: DMT family transporter [Halioglobus sp.]
MPDHSWLGATMVVAGVGIPVMAALNGGLGTKLDNPVQAATILFTLALACCLVLLWLQPRELTVDLVAAAPPHFYLGGLLVAFYVLAITWIAPIIGVGNAIMLVLTGQLFASALIDHSGWLGAPVSPLSSVRAVGILLMALGILLARRPM